MFKFIIVEEVVLAVFLVVGIFGWLEPKRFSAGLVLGMVVYIIGNLQNRQKSAIQERKLRKEKGVLLQTVLGYRQARNQQLSWKEVNDFDYMTDLYNNHEDYGPVYDAASPKTQYLFKQWKEEVEGVQRVWG